MRDKPKLAVGLLIFLGIVNLIPMGGPDGLEPPMFIKVLAIATGVSSLAAALGVIKGARWGRSVGIASRGIDALASVPAFGVGLPVFLLALIGLGMALSVWCMVILVKWEPQSSGSAKAIV